MKSGSPPPSTRLPGLGRRDFLAGTTASLLAGALLPAGCQSPDGPEPEFLPAEAMAWWRDEGLYFRHDTVDSGQQEAGLVRARVDGRWQRFRTVALPPRFVEWSLSERRTRLQDIARGRFDHDDLQGPHNACVATYGGPSREGRVSLNTAYKGMGFLPRAEALPTLLSQLRVAGRRPPARTRSEFLAQMEQTASFLDGLYSRPELFDLRKQGSLELFTSWRYYTHTFLNMMANPVASASFLDYPTFEIRAVPELLHPADPGLSPLQAGQLEYLNRIHDFVHGPGELRIACVYHLIEVYEDTPGRGGQGRKLA